MLECEELSFLSLMFHRSPRISCWCVDRVMNDECSRPCRMHWRDSRSVAHCPRLARGYILPPVLCPEAAGCSVVGGHWIAPPCDRRVWRTATGGCGYSFPCRPSSSAVALAPARSVFWVVSCRRRRPPSWILYAPQPMTTASGEARIFPDARRCCRRTGASDSGLSRPSMGRRSSGKERRSCRGAAFGAGILEQFAATALLNSFQDRRSGSRAPVAQRPVER